MTNKTIRPGNSEETTVSLVAGDGGPFQLYNSTVDFVVTDQSGAEVILHTLSVDGFGSVTVSDGLEMVGTAAEGVVMDTLTPVESALLSGWHRWQVFVTDEDGNRSPDAVVYGGWNFVLQSPYTVINGITRRELRRRILHELGDVIVVTATANGSNVTMIDQSRLTGEPNAYRGQQCLIVSEGLNNGEERYVTGSDRSSRSITFDYPLPADTEIGDEAELCNFRGMGYRFDGVHRAIEYAVESASTTATEAVAMDVAASFDRVPGTITIPDDWVSINGVQWRDDDDQPWQNMTASSRTQGSGWSVDRANRTISVGSERGYRIDEKSTRIYGFRRAMVPETDSDIVGVNAEWLVAEAVAHLSKAAYRRTPTREREQMMAIDQQQAGILRSRVLRRTGPNVVVL